MNQADIEKYAFLYFCGEKDRDILLENRKMTFEDLERFSYLTDLFRVSEISCTDLEQIFRAV